MLVNRFASRFEIPEALVSALSDAMPGAVPADEAGIFFVDAPGAGRQVATALPCPQLGWTLVKLTPASEAFARTQRLRNTIIAVNAGSLLLILLLYALLSRHVYQPIRRMVQRVAGAQPGDVYGDEFDHVVRLYDAMRGELSALKQERMSREDFLRLFESVSGIDSRTLSQKREDIPQGDKNIRSETLAQSIINAIDKQFDDPQLNAAAIAGVLGVSPAHAGRVFSRHTGMSIPEHINAVRLQKAALWLENSDLTISEITARVGYTSESYFFKLFKARYGVTPRAYAEGKRAFE
jgi:AraC-like DNA-binding protein